jgi:Fe-S oxidoreductase
VKETNPDFATWTAKERISEAKSTGAEVLVTACPGCEQSFNGAIKDTKSSLKVYDIVELLEKAI